MSLDDDLSERVERLRASGALGRSVTVLRLFDYLAARATDEASPKETEVAEAVFGRTVGFDISQDSTVRVYVHRLRKKLDDYYAGPGRGEPVRLSIPKGEYRLAAVPRDEEPETSGPAARVAQAAKPWLLGAVAALLAANLVLGGLWFFNGSDNGYSAVRRSPAWSQLLSGERPITLVVGDYYIFGEADEHAEVTRLIREYNINSSNDLSNYLMNNPTLVGKYTDLDLYYLPVSIASAMRNLMPVLAPTPQARERIRVVSASQLTPDMLRRNNIVYVGYISGLGLLREPVFAGSRFRVGETYDELIDQKTSKSYVSQEGGPDPGSETRRDYGYFSVFTGPDGNTLVIIAGTRDVAVMQTAEAVTTAASMKAMAAKAGKTKAFEALYEVEGLNRTNLGGRLTLVSPLDTAKIWAAQSSPHFPMN